MTNVVIVVFDVIITVYIVNVSACFSTVGKIAPHLSVNQIHPGMLFMTFPARGNSYRGVVLSIQGRKVHGLSL